MLPLLSRAEARAIDQHASNVLGVSTLVLMENAGRGATDAIVRAYPHQLTRVVIVGGSGQNGGDGWVVARHLFARGQNVLAVLVGDEAALTGDANVNFEALRRLGVECVVTGHKPDAVLGHVGEVSLFVDALFGTGLCRPLADRHAAAVDWMNAQNAPVVALDLPSGVDADTGRLWGVAVRAHRTLTFGGMKRGLHMHPGRSQAGHIEVVSLGVPSPVSSDVMLIEPKDVADALPLRAVDSHKGTAGHLLVVAGSEGHSGAARLAGQAALRAGAGLVTLAARASVYATLAQGAVEWMTECVVESDEGMARLVANLGRKRAAVIGPGLGTDAFGEKLARELAVTLPMPAVLDADALSAIVFDPGVLRSSRGPRVLTPHPAEAARLLGSTVQEVQGDRLAAARELASQTGAVVVLKGAGSIVAADPTHLAICGRGTPALGVAGTGDVLAGVLGALLLTVPPGPAARAAVYLHAVAGELAACGDRGLLASEVANAIPRALHACRGLPAPPDLA